MGQALNSTGGRPGPAIPPADGRPRSWRAALVVRLPLGLLLVGLVVRLVVWWQHRGYEPFGDEQYYYRAAVLFSQTGQYQDPPTPAWLPVQRVPLLALLAGALFRLGGVNLGPINLVQIGLSLATAAIVWRWAARLWGETASRLALALAVFSPTFITHPAAFFYTETLYTFLAAVALYTLGRMGARGGGEAEGISHTGALSVPILPASPLLGLPALAGVAIGLTALTRSSGVALLAVALVWVGVTGWRRPRRAMLLGLVVVAACALTIAPWTVRNWRTYGGFLPLDTIGAYNLWRDNALPGENPAAVLVRLTNPVEQQRVATERGLSNLLSRPDRFLAKLPGTTLYLWHLELDSYARGGGYFEDLTNRTDSFGWTLAADVAHLAVSGLALVGLALAPWGRQGRCGAWRLQVLLLLWLVANLASGIVLHSESRFRIPYQPQLIVFAALPLAVWPAVWARARQAPWRVALAGALVALVLAGAWSPRLAPVLQMQAWVIGGDLAIRWDHNVALAAYGRAIEAFPISDRPHIILGDARRRLGDVTGASEAYAAALAIQPHNVNAAVPLMHLHLQAGRAEEARAVLRAAGTSDPDLLAWSWREGLVGSISALDVGAGLEYGHVLNVYPPERSEGRAFRWTNGDGLVRLTTPAGGAARLTLMLNGTRLTASRPAEVTIVVNGRTVDRFATSGAWQTREIDIRGLGLTPGAVVQIEVRSDTFVPAGVMPGNRDSRRLGVGLDAVALVGD